MFFASLMIGLQCFLYIEILLQYTFDKWNPGLGKTLYKPPSDIHLVEPNMVPTNNKTEKTSDEWKIR